MVGALAKPCCVPKFTLLRPSSNFGGQSRVQASHQGHTMISLRVQKHQGVLLGHGNNPASPCSLAREQMGSTGRNILPFQPCNFCPLAETGGKIAAGWTSRGGDWCPPHSSCFKSSHTHWITDDGGDVHLTAINSQSVINIWASSARSPAANEAWHRFNSCNAAPSSY